MATYGVSRHSRESGNPWVLNHQIPASAGMTLILVAINPDSCVTAESGEKKSGITLSSSTAEGGRLTRFVKGRYIQKEAEILSIF